MYSGLATQQTPTLHLIITGIFHVTENLPIQLDGTYQTEVQHSSQIGTCGAQEPGPPFGARVPPGKRASLLHHLAYTRLERRQHRASSLQLVRDDGLEQLPCQVQGQ